MTRDESASATGERRIELAQQFTLIKKLNKAIAKTLDEKVVWSAGNRKKLLAMPDFPWDIVQKLGLLDDEDDDSR